MEESGFLSGGAPFVHDVHNSKAVSKAILSLQAELTACRMEKQQLHDELVDSRTRHDELKIAHAQLQENMVLTSDELRGERLTSEVQRDALSELQTTMGDLSRVEGENHELQRRLVGLSESVHNEVNESLVSRKLAADLQSSLGKVTHDLDKTAAALEREKTRVKKQKTELYDTRREKRLVQHKLGELKKAVGEQQSQKEQLEAITEAYEASKREKSAMTRAMDALNKEITRQKNEKKKLKAGLAQQKKVSTSLLHDASVVTAQRDALMKTNIAFENQMKTFQDQLAVELVVPSAQHYQHQQQEEGAGVSAHGTKSKKARPQSARPARVYGAGKGGSKGKKRAKGKKPRLSNTRTQAFARLTAPRACQAQADPLEKDELSLRAYDLPFISGQSAAASYSIPVNIQEVLHAKPMHDKPIHVGEAQKNMLKHFFGHQQEVENEKNNVQAGGGKPAAATSAKKKKKKSVKKKKRRAAAAPHARVESPSPANVESLEAELLALNRSYLDNRLASPASGSARVDSNGDFEQDLELDLNDMMEEIRTRSSEIRKTVKSPVPIPLSMHHCHEHEDAPVDFDVSPLRSPTHGPMTNRVRITTTMRPSPRKHSPRKR